MGSSGTPPGVPSAATGLPAASLGGKPVPGSGRRGSSWIMGSASRSVSPSETTPGAAPGGPSVSSEESDTPPALLSSALETWPVLGRQSGPPPGGTSGRSGWGLGGVYSPALVRWAVPGSLIPRRVRLPARGQGARGLLVRNRSPSASPTTGPAPLLILRPPPLDSPGPARAVGCMYLRCSPDGCVTAGPAGASGGPGWEASPTMTPL